MRKLIFIFIVLPVVLKRLKLLTKQDFTYEISHSHLVDHFVGSVPKQPLMPHNYQLFFLKHLATIVH